MNNDLIVLPKEMVAARTYGHQLKVLMNLPVRLVSENQVLDVLPLTDDPNYVPKRRRKRSDLMPITYYTLNEMLLFFNGCILDDLLFPTDVAKIYQIDVSTVFKWSKIGLLKKYRLLPSLTIYKRSELPNIHEIFGPYEL